MDLNTMLRDQAREGLQTKLDKAVTDGDTETARKVTDQIAALAVATAPKPDNSYTVKDAEAAVSAKADWYGVDPKKSAKAVEFAKTMNPKKFATAEAFADAVIKAVDEEFKPAAAAGNDGDGEDEDADDDKNNGKPEPRARKRTDGPGEEDTNIRPAPRRSNGPWAKLSDAPAEVQAEVKRAADKFAPKTEDGRKGFIANALAAHYRIHQQKAGKK